MPVSTPFNVLGGGDSQTLTTPDIGAATGTSLALSGKLGVGNGGFANAFLEATSDGATGTRAFYIQGGAAFPAGNSLVRWDSGGSTAFQVLGNGNTTVLGTFTASGTGTHTFGTTNTVTMAAGSLSLTGSAAAPTLTISGANANATPLIYFTSGAGGGSQQQWSLLTNTSSSGDFRIFDNTAGVSPLIITKATGATAILGNLTASGTGASSVAGTWATGAPTGGAGAWKLGIANVVSPTSPNRTITIDIGGTLYYLAAKTTND